MTIQRRVMTGLLLGVLLAAGISVTDARVAAALEIGKPAPDFTLPGTTGEKISLSQFRGKLGPYRVLWRRVRPDVNSEPVGQAGRLQQVPGAERPDSRHQRRQPLRPEDVRRLAQAAVPAPQRLARPEGHPTLRHAGREQDDCPAGRSSWWISRGSSGSSGYWARLGARSSCPASRSSRRSGRSRSKPSGECAGVSPGTRESFRGPRRLPDPPGDAGDGPARRRAPGARPRRLSR